MYFASRVQAGRMLAPRLVDKYRYENCAVLALNDGGVVVGAQIAAQLHCVLGLLVLSEIALPRESEAIGAIAMDGTFSYGSNFSSGEIDEMQSEYRGFLEEQKLTKLHEMNRLLVGGGTMPPELLQGNHVILVADGLRGQSLLTAAEAYLKPIKHSRIIVVTPMADVPALDKIHIMADEIHCLNVVDDTFEINHYFDKNDVPDHETIVKIIENIILHWQ
ncbi:MAG TPA: phosphoribosyltransferase family protein [Candidatus Saccharibacteria bacterium]|nr:phosphoribosyltransferase family protein [Candidatus Saccharibacteria bacterium]